MLCDHILSIGQTYKQAVLKIVPHLQFLDQKPLTAEAAKQGCLMSQSSLLRYLNSVATSVYIVHICMCVCVYVCTSMLAS